MKSPLPFQKYLLAIIPPEPILSEAHNLKIYLNDKYNSKAALNSPPHITLHMPFRWKEKKENLLIEKLTSFAEKVEPLTIEFENFDVFAPRVIYMRIVENQELMMLQKELARFCKRTFQLFNANRLDQPYHPHLTLAFRDLKKEHFTKAWQEFKQKIYHQSFECLTFTLLKQDEKNWKPIFHFKLSSK